MIGNDWDEKLKVIWNSDGFKKFLNKLNMNMQLKLFFLLRKMFLML